VFNTISVIRALAEPRKQSICMIDSDTLKLEEGTLNVHSSQGAAYRLHFKKVIFSAGEGNEALIDSSENKQPQMQRRPLKMVVMRGVQDDMIYAHCLGASVNPRITITSHRDTEGNIVWYMGGQLAEDGVDKSEAELIQAAKDELNTLIPWLSLEGAQWGVLEINRAEIKKSGTTRPDSFSIEQHGDVITAWPTKLALAPAMADELISLIDDENIERNTDMFLPEWGSPEYADFPWDDESCWIAATEVSG